VTSEPVNYFHTVDKTVNPDFFIKFVDDYNSLETTRVCKKIMTSFLNVKKGDKILDAGCGTGDETHALALLTGGSGMVNGIDSSEKMIIEAKFRQQKREKLPVDFTIGDIQNLDFDDDEFDSVRAERVLMHVSDPYKAISEMVRVTKPGGRVVIFDTDCDGIMINHHNRELIRKIVHLACESVSNGWIGRQIRSYYKQIGLENIRIESNTILPDFSVFKLLALGILKGEIEKGSLTENEHNQFWNYLDKANNDGTFFVAIPGFVVCGEKPH
jgi:ubiquinone/menaquinone biosynthesis C-methylase UbiE